MRLLVPLIAFTLFVAACSADDSSDAESPIEESSTEDSPVDGPSDETESAVDESPDEPEPAFTAGSFATGEVTIDGTTVEYVTVTPEGFTIDDTAPVLLALPPGGQNLSLTESVIASTYATEALARGWVVVSPAAPDGQLFFQGSEALIPGFIDWIQTWVTPEGDKLHLAGISNGGISSFRVAAQEPDRFASIIAFPGFPRSDEDRAALVSLTDIPVRMYVGETDTDWIPPMEETFNMLTELGGDVSFDIRGGEGHVMASLADGVDVFDQLDAAR